MGTEFEDENAKEKLRAMLNRQFGIGDESSRPDEWCKATEKVEAGTVLLADPKAFTTTGHSKMLEKFGLLQPLPGTDQIPPDRAADLLPVVLLVDAGDRGSMGLLLNRRTGMLMGDLGDDFKTFMIQPLWLGGTVGESGLTFLHTYPEVEGAKPLMEEEGVFFGGDIESASRVVTEGPGSGFNFRFFVQVCASTVPLTSGAKGARCLSRPTLPPEKHDRSKRKDAVRRSTRLNYATPQSLPPFPRGRSGRSAGAAGPPADLVRRGAAEAAVEVGPTDGFT
ncbi:unnamed protein product [Laminaria digitata]